MKAPAPRFYPDAQAEGFQAWVYAVCAQPGRTAPVYRSVTHLHPATRGPAA